MRTDKPSSNAPAPDTSSLDITDEKFREMHKLTVEMVEACAFTGKETGHHPTIFVHGRAWTEDNQLSDIGIYVYSILMDFNDARTKSQTMRKIGSKLMEDKIMPVAVFLTSEAWMSKLPKNQPYQPGFQPSKDPKRKEVIIIGGRTMFNEINIITTIPIARDKDGHIIKDGETLIEEGVEQFLIDELFIGFKEAGMKIVGHRFNDGTEPTGRTTK